MIVSTPQDLSLIDARGRSTCSARWTGRSLGVIENMAGFVCPHCGEGSDPFGIGGAEAEARPLGVPFLGRLPLSLAIRDGVRCR